MNAVATSSPEVVTIELDVVDIDSASQAVDLVRQVRSDVAVLEFSLDGPAGGCAVCRLSGTTDALQALLDAWEYGEDVSLFSVSIIIILLVGVECQPLARLAW